MFFIHALNLKVSILFLLFLSDLLFHLSGSKRENNVLLTNVVNKLQIKMKYGISGF